MTLKQLKRTHASLLSEFNRAVIRRRRNIKRVMANQAAARGGSHGPVSSRALYNAIYRSVMNKVADPRCGRWVKVRGVWGANSWRKYRCKA